jgi:hypothetical protein
MSIVVRDDLSVSIPEELAREVGIYKGSSVEWGRPPDGRLTLSADSKRHEIVDRFCGSLLPYLKSGESVVEDLIRERERDAILEERP